MPSSVWLGREVVTLTLIATRQQTLYSVDRRAPRSPCANCLADGRVSIFVQVLRLSRDLRRRDFSGGGLTLFRHDCKRDFAKDMGISNKNTKPCNDTGRDPMAFKQKIKGRQKRERQEERREPEQNRQSRHVAEENERATDAKTDQSVVVSSLQCSRDTSNLQEP